MDYQDRLKYLNLMTTEERRIRGDIILTYNIINKNIEMGNFNLEMSKERRTRGHTKEMPVTRTRTEIRGNFFTNRIVQGWNKLKQKTVDCASTIAFKSAYDQEIPLKYGSST